MATLPTTNRTAHLDASNSDDVWDNYGPPPSTSSTDGSNAERWDLEGSTVNLGWSGNTANAPTYRVTTPLMENACLDFNGTSEYYVAYQDDGATTIPMSDWLDVDGWTIAIAFWTEAVTADEASPWDNPALLIDVGGFIGIHVRDSGGSDKQVYLHNFDGNSDVLSVSASTGASHVVVAGIDGTNIFLTLDNGTPESTVASGNTQDITADIWVGRGYSGAGLYYDGRIGEVAIYDAALTGTALSDLNEYFADKWLRAPALATAPYQPAQRN